MKKLRLNPIVIALATISLLLFIIPFFWYPRGFVNLNGDSFRIYFLEPWLFLKNFSLFGLNPSGFNPIDPYYYTIPYLFVISLLKAFFPDPWTLIAITDGFRLSMTFISFFLLINELLRTIKGMKEGASYFAAVIGAVLYVTLISVWGWDASLFSFNHIFLYPLILYFLLLYLLDHNLLAAYALLLTSFVFSLNFNLTSAPQFFSFFPLTLPFIAIYVFFGLKKPFRWKEFLLGALIFLGIHAFHLLPQIVTLFDRTSYASQHLFDKTNIQNLGVFYFVVNREQFGKISQNLFQPGAARQDVTLFLIPVITLIGFLKTRSKLLALAGIGLIITLFLVTANITRTGVAFYEKLFYIPGFLMFRSFWEKWYFVFAFFYALTFACSFYFFIKE